MIKWIKRLDCRWFGLGPFSIGWDFKLCKFYITWVPFIFGYNRIRFWFDRNDR